MKIIIVFITKHPFPFGAAAVLLALIVVFLNLNPTTPPETPNDTPLLFDMAEVVDTGSIKSIYKSTENQNQHFTDLKGYNHYTYNHILCAGNSKDENGTHYFVTIKLDGSFSKISGNLYAQANDNYCWLEFYSQNTLIYTTDIVSKTNPVVPVDINVTGINELTVYLCRDNNQTIPANGWIYSDLLVLKSSQKTSDFIESNQSTVELPELSFLFDLPVYSVIYNGNVYPIDTNSTNIEDAEGNLHFGGFYDHILCKGTSKTDESGQSFVRYQINGKYTKISGKIYAQASTKDSWLEFYDGNRYIGSTNVINTDNPCTEVNINVSGVQNLTVYLCTNQNSHSGSWIISELTIK